MHVFRSLVALSIAVVAGAPAFAADEHRNPWKVDGWSGYDMISNGKLFSCDAVHDLGPHVSLRIERIAGRPSSEILLWDSNDGIDFTVAADVGTSVTVSWGGTQHVYKVKDSYSMMLMVVAEPGIIELLAAGGAFSLKLPNGKLYSAKLPAAPAAMANYRKCMESNQLTVN